MSLLRLRVVFSKYPKLTNSVVYAGLFGGGELTQQTIQGRKQYDWASVCRIATVGACLGPIYQVWYTRLDRALPGNSRNTIIKKVLLDQGIVGAFGAFFFFAGTAALEGKSVDGVLQDVKSKWAKAYFTGWLYWPTVQMINFRFLPTSMRAPYVGAAAFIWTNVLCFIKSVKVDTNIDPLHNN